MRDNAFWIAGTAIIAALWVAALLIAALDRLYPFDEF